MTNRTDLEEMTRDEVYALATEEDVSGRSSMTKAELIDALLPEPEPGPEPEPEARPVVGGIDPALVKLRDQTRAADASSEQSVTAPRG